MSELDKWLIRLAAVSVLLYFGWQLSAQTVVQVINLNTRAAQLQAELTACQANSKPTTTPGVSP